MISDILRKDRPGAVSQGTVVCRRCGKRESFTQYHCFDAAWDSRAREILRDGSFYQWTCPVCGEFSELTYPCRYLDREERLSVVLRPGIERENGDDPEKTGLECAEGILQKDFLHRFVGNFQAMQEQLCIRQEKLDDRVIQLIKPLIIGQLQSNGLEVWNGFFTGREQPGTSERQILYVFETDSEEAYSEPVLAYDIYLTNGEVTRQGINEYAYRMCENILRRAGAGEEDGRYYLYDLSWAIGFHNSLR